MYVMFTASIAKNPNIFVAFLLEFKGSSYFCVWTHEQY